MSRVAPHLSQRSSKTSNDAQKKPRTVHIDVYCTGSEDEDSADVESSSNSSEGDARYDLESNSTPQTVFESEQTRLRHQRVSGAALPRRWAGVQQLQPQAEKKELNTTTANLKKPNNIMDEVCESKQMLFRKHIGDQRAAKLQVLRQKYIRQSSEEASYANSSHSTIRDPYSDMSSAVNSLHAEVGDASYKDVDSIDVGLTKSDSFDYDNSLDRLRIKRMERFWSRSMSSSGYNASQEEPPEANANNINKQQNIQSPQLLQTIKENQRTQMSDTTLESSPNEEPFTAQQYPRKRPGFLQFFGPANAPANATKAPVSKVNEQRKTRWQSETRESPSMEAQVQVAQRCPSESRTMPATMLRYQSPVTSKRLEFHRNSPTSLSEASIVLPGYTMEHLERARKFGKVVAAKKPGLHVGPTKNPTCSCDSCQRWMSERFQVRARAFSIGECPVLKRPNKQK